MAGQINKYPSKVQIMDSMLMACYGIAWQLKIRNGPSMTHHSLSVGRWLILYIRSSTHTREVPSSQPQEV